MVRLALIGALTLWPATAGAQAMDWRQAGGDLFGRTAVPEVAVEIDGPSPRLEPLSQPLMEAVDRAARRHGLDPKLLHALVIVESGYSIRAVSPMGAGGLTQLMPGTAAELGVTNRFDIDQNLSGGADYLARQLLRFRDLRLALAAYNAGPGRVARLGRIPRIAETEAYVILVVDCFLALSAGRSVRTSRECRPAEAGS